MILLSELTCDGYNVDRLFFIEDVDVSITNLCDFC